MKTLKQRLSDWTDIDWAGYQLAVCLGLMEESSPFDFGKAKHVFWSNHPIGDLLFQMLDQLTAQGILEENDEPDFQYRWNAGFKGP
jgi:hypothetical protein